MLSPCTQCEDSFLLLDVTAGSSDLDLKTSHRDLVKVWHPDRFGSDSRLRAKAEERLKAINAAYLHLKDCPLKSAAHDEMHEAYSAASDGNEEGEGVPQENNERPVNDEPFTHHYAQEESPTSFARPGWLRLSLRAFWTFAKYLLLASLSLLVVFLMFCSMVISLQDYWKNEKDIHENPNWRPDGRRFFDSIAAWTGLPEDGARGFIFVLSLVLLLIGGACVWSLDFIRAHQQLGFGTLGISLCITFAWALASEKRKAEISQGSRIGSEIAGGIVLAGVLIGTLGFGPDLWKASAAPVNTIPAEQRDESVVTQKAKPLASRPQSDVAGQSVEVSSVTETRGTAMDEQSSEDSAASGWSGRLSDSITPRDAEIIGAIESWRRTTMTGDAEQIADLYASRIKRYYTKTDVDRAFVLGETARDLERSSINYLRVSNPKTEINPQGGVTAQFTEDYSYERDSHHIEGKVITILNFVREDGSWKINFIRQLKV